MSFRLGAGTNVRPGFGPAVVVVRSLANRIRNWAILTFRYPWVRHSGFVRIPGALIYGLPIGTLCSGTKCNSVSGASSIVTR
jgi:hypothetical protein